MTKIKVLFVCLGNICRSPLAEAIFREKVSAKGLVESFEINSCGTANYHVGEGPDSRTLANALKNGIRIDHCGQQLSVQNIEYYDFILAMDRSNFSNIMRLKGADEHAHKIFLMREFDPHERGAEVPDPYYGGESGFQHVFEILDRSTESFLEFLQKEHLKS